MRHGCAARRPWRFLFKELFMQWLIDLIAEKVLQNMSGLIVLWSGAIVDLPDGWVLCDGNNGTPNLQDRFLVGAGVSYAVGATGGSTNQTHTFTSNNHSHSLAGLKEVQSGTGLGSWTDSVAVTGTTNSSNNRPPFYALAYIMKL